MARNVDVSCRCGAVHGRVTGATPQTVNRATCYCDDCQAFAHWLKRPELLDAHGASDIIQVAPAALSFDRGQDQIRCVRLTDKGLFRWYASCCNTPLGNSLRPAIPFVGILATSFVATPAQLDEAFGRSRGAIFGQFAIGDVPPEAQRFDVRLVAGSFWRVLGFRLRGKTWPHPFFERETQLARYPITALTPDERDALRPLCGPKPTSIEPARA